MTQPPPATALGLYTRLGLGLGLAFFGCFFFGVVFFEGKNTPRSLSLPFFSGLLHAGLCPAMTQHPKLLHFPEKLPLPTLRPLSPCPTVSWDTNRISKDWDDPACSIPNLHLLTVLGAHPHPAAAPIPGAIPCFSVPLPARSGSGMLQGRQQSDCWAGKGGTRSSSPLRASVSLDTKQGWAPAAKGA